MFRLSRYLVNYRKEMILGPFFKLLEAIFELLIPAMVALMIDVGVANEDRGYIIRMGAAMAAIAVAGTGCAFLCQYYAAKAAQGFGTTLRNRVFKKIGTLAHADLDRFDAVTLGNRVTSDVNALQWAVAMLVRLVIRAPFLCIGGFVMALILDFSLSLIVLLALPIFSVLIWWLMKRSIPLFGIVQKKLDAMTRILRENLAGVRAIRSFAMEDREATRYGDANRELAEAAFRAGRASSLLNPVTALVLNFAIVAVVGFGGVRLQVGDLTAGTIIAFIQYLTMILAAMIVVANLAVVFTRASASAGRVNEILDLTPAIQGPVAEGSDLAVETGLDAVPQSSDEAPFLSFHHVTFSYPGAAEPSLTDVSFTLRRGQTLGIVGVTGSGKSTLLSLLPRFYDPQGGSVRLEGRDVRTLSLDALRGRVGLVSQNPQLFSGTILENIRRGNPEATEEEVREAARLAQADYFIQNMTKTYQARVERSGRNLSGGQRQRLAIARALVRKPDLLLLDDSTSALDQATDAALRRALRTLPSTTMVIVSQRIRAVKEADLILVLEDGALVGKGTHQELLTTCPLYAELDATQREGGATA